MVAGRNYRLALAALIVVFVTVRVWGLTDSCLWFDEIFSVHAAEHSWSSVLTFVAQDLIHPPLFYLVLKTWISIGGEGVFWLRLLSVTIASVSLIPFLLLCKQFELSSRLILLAAFFLAVNGSVIKYSQEVRMYSLLMCLSLFSFWLFVRFCRHGKGIIPLLVINILLVYSHYFGWFAVFSEIVCTGILYRAKLRPVLLVSVGVVAAFLPWFYFVWDLASVNNDLYENIGWIDRPTIGDLAAFLMSVVEPFYVARVSTDAISDYRVSMPLAIIFVVAVAVFFVRKRKPEDPETERRQLLLFILVPLIAAFVLSWVLPYSIWGIRHLILVFAPGAILLAVGIDKFPVRSVRIGATTLIILFCGYAFVRQLQHQENQYSWCRWEQMENKVGPASFTQPVTIYALEDLVAYHLWFNVRENGNTYRINKVTGVEGVPEDKAYFLPRGFDGVKKVSIDEIPDEKFWIAFRAEDWNVTKPPLNEFILRGYRLREPITSQAIDGELFLVPVEK